MRKPLIFLFAALAVLASGFFVLLGEWQDPKPVASHGVPPGIERRTFVEQSVAVNRSVESASKAAIPSEASPPARFRKDFLASTDLHALYNALLSSKEPGAQMYATAALAECSAFRGHFGSGSDAWFKFNDLVPEGAPDRSERVRLFRLMQDRCRGFTESKLKLALEGLGILFRKPSGDPYAESLATLTKNGLAHDKRVSGETLASAVRFALESRDPELLSALANAWIKAESPKGVLRIDEEVLASRLAWTVAIERVTGSTPLSFIELRNANCITGKGCEPTTVTEAYRLFMSDRPAERVGAIVAAGEQLVPSFEGLLRERDVERFLRDRS